MSSGQLVALIDDDDAAREAASSLVRALGYSVVAYPSAAAFLATAEMSQIACLITDMRMAGMSGLALHRHLTTSGIYLPTILTTAYPEDATRNRAERAGLVCYLSKPLAPGALRACIQGALDRAEASTPMTWPRIEEDGP